MSGTGSVFAAAAGASAVLWSSGDEQPASHIATAAPRTKAGILPIDHLVWHAPARRHVIRRSVNQSQRCRNIHRPPVLGAGLKAAPAGYGHRLLVQPGILLGGY